MSQDTLDYFRKEYQRGLVANTLRTSDLLQKLQDQEFGFEDLSSPLHSAIIRAASEILKLQNGFDPDTLILAETLAQPLKYMLKEGSIFHEEKEPLLREIELIYDMELDPRYYSHTLPQFLSECRIKKAIRNHKGSSEELVRKANSIIESLPGRGVEINRVISPLINPQLSNVAVVTIPSGIGVIDRNMCGGLGKGEFGIICGISGLGKTTLAVNFCWGAALSGKKAALITLELTSKKISERLYSRISQIDYNRIRFGDNGVMEEVNREVWEHVEQIPPAIRGNFDIWDYSDESVSLRQLDAKLAKLAREGNLPDMVFLDWLDALGTDPSERKNGYVAKELRHVLQNHSQGCAELARRYNIAIWATTQSNSKGDNQRRIGMSNAAEGFGKAWRCSVFLGMGATEEDREHGNVITVTAGKMRDGQIFSSQLRARLNVQTFEDIDAEEDLLNSNPNFRPLNNQERT